MHVIFPRKPRVGGTETPTRSGAKPADLVVLSLFRQRPGRLSRQGWRRAEGKSALARLGQSRGAQTPAVGGYLSLNKTLGREGHSDPADRWRAYWPYGLQQVKAWRDRGIALAVLACRWPHETRLRCVDLARPRCAACQHLCDQGGAVAAQAALPSWRLRRGCMPGRCAAPRWCQASGHGHRKTA